MSATFSNWISRAPINAQTFCELFKTNFALNNMEVKTLKSQS